MTDFGWGYPPGVTGREYEIAGPDWVGVRVVECGAWVGAEEDDTDGICPFQGNADVEIFEGVMWWDCEMCGTEHEEELRDEA